MSIQKLESVRRFLGPMYSIQKRDSVDMICRNFCDRFEFEITGFLNAKSMTINLWQLSPHIELLAIYSGITDQEMLADALGYLAFKYRNLRAQIQVEREDPAR